MKIISAQFYFYKRISAMKIRMFNPRWITMMAVVLLSFFFSGCKSYYVVADFNGRTADHKTIAILPFEMIFTGVKPEKLTDQDLQLIGEAESKAFMISFYNEVLRSTKGGKKAIRVDIQHYDRTLSLLKANNMDIRSAWTADPADLLKILGVDAVVKARVEKHRLMSDLASYGIDLGIRILSVLTDYGVLFWLPPEVTKAKEIKSSYSLLDKEGSVLWSVAFDVDADWSEPANEIIDHINRRSAKTFPYRNK
jgi:hypothetical protein